MAKVSSANYGGWPPTETAAGFSPVAWGEAPGIWSPHLSTGAPEWIQLRSVAGGGPASRPWWFPDQSFMKSSMTGAPKTQGSKRCPVPAAVAAEAVSHASSGHGGSIITEPSIRLCTSIDVRGGWS
jgi:hypothetical protein